MYAVVSSGGKQYRVEPGSTLTMERLSHDGGATITFDRVLLVGDGEAVTVGTPTVSGATVSGTVLGEELGPKLVVFKFKQKVKYRRRTGHRQHLVRVRIDGITANGRTVSAEEAAAARPAAEPKRRARRARASESPGAESAAKPAPKAGARKGGRSAGAAKASPKAETKRGAAAKDDASGTKPRARRSPASKKSEAKE